MATNASDDDETSGKWVRGAMNAAGGMVPFAGGFISAAASVWGEEQQERAMEALRNWIRMLQDELREKERTIIEIMSRLDMHDEKIAERVRSAEYQTLLKQAFRNWAGTESAQKQAYIRNVLTNAASSSIVSDDVVRMFMKWLHDYSELHFTVIGALYNNRGLTRGGIWRRIGKGKVREDSAEADLFKLLVRDLSTGGIIRQHRETDYHGNYVKKEAPRSSVSRSDRTMKSAFDETEAYELTALGDQFVHYAMNEVTVKIAYSAEDDSERHQGGRNDG